MDKISKEFPFSKVHVWILLNALSNYRSLCKKRKVCFPLSLIDSLSDFFNDIYSLLPDV